MLKKMNHIDKKKRVVTINLNKTLIYFFLLFIDAKYKETNFEYRTKYALV